VIYVTDEENKQIVTSLRVDPKLWKKAKVEAIEHDITLGELIDEAIREWIQKKEKHKH
jgi:predicted HicB family RNase H-like nuclease